MCISLMKESNIPHLPDEDGWGHIWTLLRYWIGCMEVAELIVDRLGNKAEKQCTRDFCRIASNSSVGMKKLWSIPWERFYMVK